MLGRKKHLTTQLLCRMQTTLQFYDSMLFGSVSSPLGGLVLVKAGRAMQVDRQRN